MIDKIEEVANRYASDKCSNLEALLSKAFHSGIDWFLNNLWHDAAEEPEDYRLFLVEMPSASHPESTQFVVSQNGIYPSIWKDNVKALKFIRWLYISDLLKEGIET